MLLGAPADTADAASHVLRDPLGELTVEVGRKLDDRGRARVVAHVHAPALRHVDAALEERRARIEKAQVGRVPLVGRGAQVCGERVAHRIADRFVDDRTQSARTHMLVGEQPQPADREHAGACDVTRKHADEPARVVPARENVEAMPIAVRQPPGVEPLVAQERVLTRRGARVQLVVLPGKLGESFSSVNGFDTHVPLVPVSATSDKRRRPSFDTV